MKYDLLPKSHMPSADYTFYEFFSGGGLARLGLGPDWTCLFANDNSPKKGEAYRQNFFPADELLIDDVQNLTVTDLPGQGTLAWSSFPCQDLSLAGNGNGLHAQRSGAFWPFWQLLLDKQAVGHKIPLIVLENVTGLLTSNQGQDFQILCQTIIEAGYKVGAAVINADKFVPQSRPRLFIVAAANEWALPKNVTQPSPTGPWFPKRLIHAQKHLSGDLRQAWVWWNIPLPQQQRRKLVDVIEMDPSGVTWHTEEETERLLSLMSEKNLQKVRAAQQAGVRQVGTVYRRTRKENEVSVLRAEVRFDDTSGCLRTPAGGSSRQIVMIVEGEQVRSRLLSPREAARLMGLEDSYLLPERYNDAYHVMGDAVVVSVVQWLEKHLLRPIIDYQQGGSKDNLLPQKQGNICPAIQLSLADF